MATTAEVSKPMESNVRMETGAPVPPPMTTAFKLLVSGTTGSAAYNGAKASVMDGSWGK